MSLAGAQMNLPYAGAKACPRSSSDKSDAIGDRVVTVVGNAADAAPLLRLLEQLNYSVKRLDASDVEAGAADDEPTMLFADNSGERILKACNAAPLSATKMVVCGDNAFDFRLALAKAGVSGVVKPSVGAVELANALKQVLRRTDPVSVLVVDDDEVAGQIYVSILNGAGMQACLVTDPRQVAETLNRALPDVVLMDIHMPEISGLDLTRVIRLNSQLVSLPIIFLSAERNRDRQHAARMLGGDDFIGKPVDPKRLVEQVRLRAERARALREMIEKDGLTGLFNHKHFNERLSLELEHARRTGVELSLAVIDIDHFKRVNDSYGHPVGDMVLCVLAALFQSGLRRTDVIGRCGGEEFGIVLPNTGMDEALRVVEKLRERFADTEIAAGRTSVRATFSAGLAASASFARRQELVDAADRALYGAKHAGRNRTVISDE